VTNANRSYHGSSLVIDELCDRVANQKIAVACFYCDFQNQKTQTLENVLGALVKQIVRGLRVIPAEVDAAFQKAKGQVGGRGLRVPEILSLLKASLAPLDRAFICIDALDELLVKHLPTLLRSLHTISQFFPRIRYFFTGRPFIEDEIGRCFPGSALLLQMKPTREDVMKYVKMMLADDPDPEAMSPDLQAEIMIRVSETISDVYVKAISSLGFVPPLTASYRFLLVSLHIAAILDETTIYDRRQQLKRMTTGCGLGDAYCATLDRIKAQSGGRARLGMAALMWISKSERPMSPDELCHVLGVRTWSTDPDPESNPSMQSLLASCFGLVMVNKEESSVRLVHFTLQEYLSSCPEMFQNPYASMAEACLTYLNFDCIRKLPSSLDSAIQKHPFLQYSSSYWGQYVRNEATEAVKSLALQLLEECESHILVRLLLHQHIFELRWGMVGLGKGFTGLHCVAYLGISEIAEALLNMKPWDVDKPDFLGCTPLIWASKNGCEGIITLLLETAGANVNMQDSMYGRTPLSWAARSGQEGAAKLLLERYEVDPESRDNDGRTPLSHAAKNGNEGIVRLFLGLGQVNPDSLDNSGRTPLFWAAQYGQVGAAKLLLDRENVNPETRDKYGRTPLSCAAWYRQEGAVKLLLGRDGVDPESRDYSGRTALSYAIESGSEGILKLFLQLREANLTSRANDGLTPLSHVAEYESEGAINLLLEPQEDIPESPDDARRTLLSNPAASESEKAPRKDIIYCCTNRTCTVSFHTPSVPSPNHHHHIADDPMHRRRFRCRYLECGTCGGFIRRVDRDRHERLNHQPAKFTCSVCGYQMKRLDNMRVHVGLCAARAQRGKGQQQGQ